MSRIGKLPVNIPAGVEINVNNDNFVTVKGKLGTLTQQLPSQIKLNIENGVLSVVRENEEKQVRAWHGLYRSLLSNMVKGVSEGYVTTLELVGVGYKCAANGQILDISLGYSHNIVLELPAEISVETVTEKGQNPKIILKSFDKQLIGQVAAKIRSFRKPEPYKGKGVKFLNEVIRRKAGKAASAK